MSNNGIPPLNDWQADNYPVIYDEGDAKSYYVKSGVKNEITGGSTSYLVAEVELTDAHETPAYEGTPLRQYHTCPESP